MAKTKLLTYLSFVMPIGFVQKAQDDTSNAPGATNLDANKVVLNLWSDAFL